MDRPRDSPRWQFLSHLPSVRHSETTRGVLSAVPLIPGHEAHVRPRRALHERLVPTFQASDADGMRDEPSATARFVAEHILLLGSRIHALLGVPREQIEWTARVLEASGWSLGVVSSWRSTLVERFSIPGIRTHYVLRKKIIEREVLQAIDEGCRQVVVVGAGFDVLPFRLAAEFPLVTFIELDHAATQNAKRVVAERYGSRIEFVGSDLRNEPIDVAVKRVAFDAEKRTAFVVEGVLTCSSPKYINTPSTTNAVRFSASKATRFTATSIGSLRRSEPTNSIRDP